jgi:signal peptidase I
MADFIGKAFLLQRLKVPKSPQNQPDFTYAFRMKTVQSAISSTFSSMSDQSPDTDTKNGRKGSSFLGRIFRLIFLGFLCWLIVRCFFIQGMYIPTNSMAGTLNKGDKIYVNKLAYGPRIPMTPLCIPFTDKNIYLDWIALPYWRIPGYADVQRNDVIVFNLPTDTVFPVDLRKLYIKRCVGLPGESVQIREGVVYVNGEEIALAGNPALLYSVALKKEENPDSLFGKLGIAQPYSTTDRIHYVLMMTWAQADALDSTGKTNSIVRSLIDPDRYDYKMFPQNTSKAYRWNPDNFGAVKIPEAGDSIALTLNNIHLYKTAIAIYEGNTLENRHDSVFINGKFAPSYTFKMNYYFVLGDNRYDSNDSRYWGFVPEDHLVGRAIVE